MMFFTVLALSLTIGAVVGDECYTGWVKWQDKCYGFGESLVTWGEAQQICNSFNGKLVELETPEENEFVRNLVMSKKNVKHVFLGGVDIFYEGRWEWVSTKLSFTWADWGRRMPDDSKGSEDCLALWKGVDYHWNDLACSDQAYFVCESDTVDFTDPNGIGLPGISITGNLLNLLLANINLDNNGLDIDLGLGRR